MKQPSLSPRAMTEGMPHFNKGNLPVAFVFSVPGARELAEGRPAAADTGDNLTLALEFLNAADPDTFPSVDRYEYRITNSWMEPLARSLGSPSSEPKDSEVRQPENTSRVVYEVRGCKLVVLCGSKAQLLTGWVQSPARIVAHACHTGNRGLNGKYKNQMLPAVRLSADRRRARAELWAKEVLRSIADNQAT